MFGSKTEKIAKLAQKGQVAKLTGFINDKDASVRLAAIDALGTCAGEESYNALVPLVHAADADVRAHAISALAASGNARARVHIEHQAKDEKDARVKQAIEKALHTLHGGE